MMKKTESGKFVFDRKNGHEKSLVQFNYMPRVIGFLLHGVILTSIFHESRNAFLWLAIFLQVVVWPQIAYLHGMRSRHPRSAEYRNLYVEAFLCGVWINLVAFQLWPSTVFFLGAAINLLATRGLVLFRNALAFLGAGICFAGIFNGFDFVPDSSLLTACACIAFIVVYSSIVAHLSFQTSKKLSMSRQRTEMILNAIQSGVLVVEVASRRIIEANRAAVEMFGVAREKIIGQVCHRFVCPAEEKNCPLLDRKLQIDNAERVLLDKDGKEIPILKTAVPLILDGKKCLLESFVDIRKRKQMEEELRRLARAVEQSIDGIAVADMDGFIQFANSAWAKMHGYRAEELPGEHIRIFHTREQLENEVHVFNKKVIENGSNEDEVGHVRNDGKTFPTWMTTTVLKDEEGRNVGLLGIARDITERKKVEDELRISLEKVETVNADLERQTVVAKELALQSEAANMAKSRFLANMSHEIRTPMNAVIGMSHLLSNTELTSEQRRFVETIQQSADSLLTVISDILDFSKIEAGKLDLETVDFDLIRMLDDTNSMLALNAREKKLAFHCRIDPEVPRHVAGDPGRLRQVLVNLVGNAIKFTSEGEIQIQVGLAGDDDRADGPKTTLLFSIVDTGIGIPDEKMETLFEAFTQVDVSTTRKFGGTGLGLSIVKNLVELMGGRISVSSQVGKGSTFTFSVVLQKAIQVERETGASEEAYAEFNIPGMNPDGVRILVAEDYPINQEVVQGFLEQFGFAAHIVGDGIQAIQALEENDYDLVLMDVQMPGMDGVEATQVIRGSDTTVRNREIPIIALTGNAMAGDRNRFLEAGMNDYLAKPIRPNELYDVVMRNLPKNPEKG